MPVIRPLGEANIDTVYDLGINEPSFCFEKPGFWDKSQLSAWFRSQNDVCLGAFDGSEIIGFTLASLHVATRKATWENLYVLPAQRNTGVAESLVEEMMKQLKEKGAMYVHFLVDFERKRLHEYFNRMGFNSSGAFMWMGQPIEQE